MDDHDTTRQTSMTPTLHHVNLKTCRLDEMISWYGTTVGMRVQHRFAGGAWLTNDDANHRLALLCPSNLSDDPEKIQHAGLHHTAYEFATMEALLATYERLKALGILPHACLDHGMTLSMYFVDPDGNSLELQADVFGDWVQSTAFMHTADFERDPIGTPFDPDQALAAWKGGATPADLHRRAYEGDFNPAGSLDLRLPGATQPVRMIAQDDKPV